MANKFSKGLVKEYKKAKAEALHQEKLRQEYNITDEKIKVVEKKTTFKFIINLLLSLLRFLATVALLILATVGLLCLVYPQPREAFLVIFNEITFSVKLFLGLV